MQFAVRAVSGMTKRLIDHAVKCCAQQQAARTGRSAPDGGRRRDAALRRGCCCVPRDEGCVSTSPCIANWTGRAGLPARWSSSCDLAPSGERPTRAIAFPCSPSLRQVLLQVVHRKSATRRLPRLPAASTSSALRSPCRGGLESVWCRKWLRGPRGLLLPTAWSAGLLEIAFAAYSSFVRCSTATLRARQQPNEGCRLTYGTEGSWLPGLCSRAGAGLWSCAPARRADYIGFLLARVADRGTVAAVATRVPRSLRALPGTGHNLVRSALGALPRNRCTRSTIRSGSSSRAAAEKRLVTVFRLPLAVPVIVLGSALSVVLSTVAIPAWFAGVIFGRTLQACRSSVTSVMRKKLEAEA